MAWGVIEMSGNKIPTNSSEIFCRKIKANGKTQYYGVGGGLRLRVSPKGSKSWIFNYNSKTADGYKTRSYTIGPFKQADTDIAAFSVAGAKRELLRLKNIVNSGGDPSLDKQALIQQRITEEAEKLTVKQLYDLWFEAEPVNRKDKGAEVDRMMKKDILSVIGNLDAKVITKPHIQKVMQPVEKRGVRIAGVVFSLLRQFFGWAEDRGYIENDPVAKFRKKIGSSGNERDRILTEEELIDLFAKLPKAGLSEVLQLAIQIQLGTACRGGELLKARWEHIDFDESTWVIPAEHSKNGKPHLVHLSRFAHSLLNELFEITGDSLYLYPAARGTGHTNTQTITKSVSDRQRDRKDILKGRTVQFAEALILSGGQWRPHDLRRTSATLMAELGVLPDVIERCLNHTEVVKVRRIYQRHDYLDARKAAFELLGERLTELGENAKLLTKR